MSILVPENASTPVVDAAGSLTVFALEGENLTIMFTVEAEPPVMASGISWFFVQAGTNSTIEITTSSMLNDGSAQLQFSEDRLSLTLTGVAMGATGLYFITATNIAGIGTNYTYLQVQSKFVQFNVCRKMVITSR